jgi:hypothetical protein
MARRVARKTFADTVREVEAMPPAQRRVGLSIDGVLTDPAGRQYTRVADVSAERALEVAAAGAVVVWDPCGCGGGCGFDWCSATEVQQLVASGPPVVANSRRLRGNISEWRTASGAALLLAEDMVRWGNRMS